MEVRDKGEEDKVVEEGYKGPSSSGVQEEVDLLTNVSIVNHL